MQTNRTAAVLLAVALGLATAACGSSDSDGAASTTTAPAKTTTTAKDADTGGGGTASPEKAAFLEAADKICKESTDKINAETEGLDAEEFDDAAFEAFLKKAAQESIKQITAVRAIGFPADDADELDAAFTTFEEAFAKVVADPSKTLDYTSTPEFEKASTFLTDYGFEECGGAGE